MKLQPDWFDPFGDPLSNFPEDKATKPDVDIPAVPDFEFVPAEIPGPVDGGEEQQAAFEDVVTQSDGYALAQTLASQSSAILRGYFEEFSESEFDLIEIDTLASAKPPKDDSDKGGGNGGGGGGNGGGGGGKGGGKPGSGDGGNGDGTLSSYTSSAEGSDFNIDIVFSGTWTTALQDAFITAADYISSIILGDVTDTVGPISVDDIEIEASLIEIDGPGMVLGRAGPTAVRSGTYLPATGIMEFDIADAENYDAQGLWDDIVFHEMMHTLGFGTMWETMGLTSGSIAGDDLIFTGDMATSYYNSDFFDLSGGTASGIPIETDGSSGTAGGHWDDELFANEIMTGYIDGSNYLSTMSIAALEDMGYDTVLDDPNDEFDLVGTIPDAFFIG